MLNITLHDGSQVSVQVAIIGGEARTIVNWRQSPGACWEPLDGKHILTMSGWDRIELAVQDMATTKTTKGDSRTCGCVGSERCNFCRNT